MPFLNPRVITVGVMSAREKRQPDDILLALGGPNGGSRATETLSRAQAELLYAKLAAALSPEADLPVVIQIAPEPGKGVLWARADGTGGLAHEAKRFASIDEANAFAVAKRIKNYEAVS